MNLSELKTLVIPQGEVYEIFNSTTGILLWKKNRKFTVVFDSNGGTGTMASQEFTVGELQAIQSNTFTKSGDTFYGWSLTPDGSPQYSNGQQVTGIGTCDGTITLYAVWAMSLNTKYTFTSNSTFVVPMTGVYTIELHGGGGGGAGNATASASKSYQCSASGGGGGGSGSKYTTTLTKGTSYALIIGKGGSGSAGSRNEKTSTSVTSESDYGSDGETTKFGSLYSVAGGKGGGGAKAFTRDTKGTAVATHGKGGSASGNIASAGGAGTDSSGGTGGSGGSTVGNYGAGGEGGKADTGYKRRGESGQNGAIFVTLVEYSPYTVNFNANGGTGSMTPQTFNVDESQSLSMNAFTYSGYNFAGWSTSPTGNVMYNNGESVKNIGNSGETVTLYAIWTIPVGTKYTYTSNTTFVVPATGTYTIELHGGGGGGGGAAVYSDTGGDPAAIGGAGGGSGAKYTTTLTKGTSYALTIGVGGAGGAAGTGRTNRDAQGKSGSDGGTTKFGDLYTCAGGGGGTGGYASGDYGGTEENGSTGTAKGNLASGQSGGSSVGSYGKGGDGGRIQENGLNTYPFDGSAGQSGAVIITFVG